MATHTFNQHLLLFRMRTALASGDPDIIAYERTHAQRGGCRVASSMRRITGTDVAKFDVQRSDIPAAMPMNNRVDTNQVYDYFPCCDYQFQTEKIMLLLRINVGRFSVPTDKLAIETYGVFIIIF